MHVKKGHVIVKQHCSLTEYGIKTAKKLPKGWHKVPKHVMIVVSVLPCSLDFRLNGSSSALLLLVVMVSIPPPAQVMT
jgi:hypothetical protein